MEYHMWTYDDADHFNEDAKARYSMVVSARTATSYDRFWKVEEIMTLPDGRLRVLWSRPAELRKH